MNLEESISGVIQQKLKDGTIEKIIAAKFEKGIDEAMDNLFRSYGDIGKVIKEKVSSVMIPAIEKHDFSDHLVKLDTILTEIVNKTSLSENQRLLENFKELMIEDNTKEISVSKLFELWCDYVKENVDTNGLEVCTDDGEPEYESVECSVTVEFDEKTRNWTSFKKANVIFECDQDEKMNFSIPISRWKTQEINNWEIDYNQEPNINSLRYMGAFEVLILKLKRSSCKLHINTTDESESVTPEEVPEASFS